MRYRMPGTLPASPKEVAFELLRPIIAELRPGLGTPWRWKVGSSHWIGREWTLPERHAAAASRRPLASLPR